VTARAKSVDRFLAKAQKAENDKPKYTEPLRQIQDQVGARVVTFYLSDVDRVAAIVEGYYRSIEARSLVPDFEGEFRYFGRHYVMVGPNDVIDPATDKELVPEVFELQAKTLFQHAWSTRPWVQAGCCAADLRREASAGVYGRSGLGRGSHFRRAVS